MKAVLFMLAFGASCLAVSAFMPLEEFGYSDWPKHWMDFRRVLVKKCIRECIYEDLHCQNNYDCSHEGCFCGRYCDHVCQHKPYMYTSCNEDCIRLYVGSKNRQLAWKKQFQSPDKASYEKYNIDGKGAK